MAQAVGLSAWQVVQGFGILRCTNAVRSAILLSLMCLVYKTSLVQLGQNRTKDVRREEPHHVNSGRNPEQEPAESTGVCARRRIVWCAGIRSQPWREVVHVQETECD